MLYKTWVAPIPTYPDLDVEAVLHQELLGRADKLGEDALQIVWCWLWERLGPHAAVWVFVEGH